MIYNITGSHAYTHIYTCIRIHTHTRSCRLAAGAIRAVVLIYQTAAIDRRESFAEIKNFRGLLVLRLIAFSLALLLLFSFVNFLGRYTIKIFQEFVWVASVNKDAEGCFGE